MKILMNLRSISLLILGLFLAFLINKIFIVQYFIERILGPDALNIMKDFKSVGLGFQGLTLSWVLFGLASVGLIVIAAAGVSSSKFQDKVSGLQKKLAGFASLFFFLGIVSLVVWQQSSATKYKELEAKKKEANVELQEDE